MSTPWCLCVGSVGTVSPAYTVRTLESDMKPSTVGNERVTMYRYVRLHSSQTLLRLQLRLTAPRLLRPLLSQRLGPWLLTPQMVWVCLNWGTLSCPLRACMNRSSTGGLHLWKPRRHLRLRLLFLACQKRIGLL